MKKLLIWDGDETLWYGTVLEGDSPDLPEDRRRLVEELTERGVLQSLASWNDPKDIARVLHELDLEAHILAPQAALATPKSEMVKAIMNAFHLTRPEDVVFVDDQAFHCGEVEAALPGVTTLSPAMLQTDAIDFLFSKPMYTDDDRARVRRMRAELARQQGAAAYGKDMTAFLRTCGMRMRLFTPGLGDIGRVRDLVTRANRMSALARPFPPEELRSNMPGLLACSVTDKYGDYGTTGVLLHEDGVVVLLVISCRMQGKGIGSALLGSFINQHVGRRVGGRWRETPYNGGMRGLYDWYGFTREPSDDTSLNDFFLDVREPVKLPDWIEITS